ncbi:MAG: class II SORL domain-containing protein [Theionarchaea archaeon]|nr:MAG: Neelaredoxin [Theionarchaea archaeon DG-70]MBU7010035.1 class II SORL domain-containing protein [Theionarchaea archaeon]
MRLGDRLQEADWKKEKHVPVIECPDEVKADEFFEVKVGLGKAIAHPNTTEHHIRWIQLFFHPEGEKFTYQVANFQFTAHGESIAGPDTSSIYTHHQVLTWMKTSKSGTLYAMSYCNIHGLWQSAKEITVV